MSTTKTRSDLIEQCLDDLGVLAVGQAPSSEDGAKIDARIDAVVAELSELDIINIQDVGQQGPLDGEIPLAVFFPLSAILADRCAGGFGLSGDPAIAAEAAKAEMRLKTIARTPRTRATLETDAQLRGSRRLIAGTYRGG